MTDTSVPIAMRIDAELDRVQRHRERLMAESQGAKRSTRMAVLYDREARLWSALFEHARLRVYWRAALAAEAHAHQLARRWRRRAAVEAQETPMSELLGGSVELSEVAGGTS